MPTIDAICTEIEQMPLAEIQPIARAAVGDDNAAAQPGWSASPMNASSVGSGTLGFIVATGEVSAGATAGPWRSVVKVLDPNADGFFKFVSPRREIEVFRSGFLPSLTGNLQGVPCHGITDRPDGVVLLWLKDLSNATLPPWSKENFITAARHLGQFNGSWPEERAPVDDWLDRTFITNRPQLVLNRSWDDLLLEVSEHPVIDRVSARIGRDKLFAMVDEFREIASASAKLPRVVTHNDAHSRNMYIDTDDAGHEITYLADWASVGLGPVGLDGGTLAGGGLIWREEEARLVHENESLIFESYLEGLRDAEWAIDLPAVRLGYLSNFAIYPLAHAMAAAQTAGAGGNFAKEFPSRFGLEGDEFIDQLALRLELFMPLFDEAVELARET